MRAAAWIGLLVVAGCAPEITEGYFACAGVDSDCPEGWTCRSDDRCWRTPGGVPDGGPRDAGADANADGSVDAGACVPLPLDIDLLVMVDKSGSMTEEQAALTAAFPELIRALTTGDVDGDGMRDFLPIESLHVGVVTSDLGALGNIVPTCSGQGDDGVLVDTPLTAMVGCAASYPSFLEFTPGDSVSQLGSDFACLATVGAVGCGFEQQLEAVLKATVDRSSSYVFYDGTVGHGDGANAGFLRDGSVLVTLLVTDEEDCSTLDADLFAVADGPYVGTDLNLRCYLHDGALTAVSRYVEGLGSLRSDPADLVFAALVGVPPRVQESSYAAMLADPDMDFEVDPAMPLRPLPACDGGTGAAYPGRRFIEVAQGLEARGSATLIRSICQSNFHVPIDALLNVLAPRLRDRSCEG